MPIKKHKFKDYITYLKSRENKEPDTILLGFFCERVNCPRYEKGGVVLKAVLKSKGLYCGSYFGNDIDICISPYSYKNNVFWNKALSSARKQLVHLNEMCCNRRKQREWFHQQVMNSMDRSRKNADKKEAI